MRVRRLLVVLALGAAAILVVSAPGLGNSRGASPGWGTSGCTCHSSTPSNEVSVTLEGIPAHVEPGATYQATVSLRGGPVVLPAPIGQNQGGFAFDFANGTAKALDGTVQVVQGTVTHTSAGNDVRSWKFSWTAPNDPGTITFKIAGNAVNGDGVNNPLDQWNRKTVAVEIHGMENDTAPPVVTTPTPESPAPSLVLVVLATAIALAGVAMRARRR